ncbi:hypothetical protein OPQ81_002982 [Rhizoctonia solani]|nr:hypothetical protein OPQ81_002982 [Rhizoctonia solani]
MGRINYSPVEGVLRIRNTSVLLNATCYSLVLMRSIICQPRVFSVASLPVEIIDLISEELLAMGATSELAALSLLGNRYVHVVQRRLFRHIDIPTYSRYARLMRTLQFGGDNPERCHVLASMIRCLSITISPFRFVQDEFQLCPRHIFNLYDNLPMLEFIDLNESPIGGLGRSLVPIEQDLDLLATLNSLRSVALTGHLGGVGLSMLIALPHLEEVHLFGNIPASLFSLEPPRSGNSIRRLTWGANTLPTLQRIRWVFGESEEVMDGELVLLTLPSSEAELNAIRWYALERGMAVRVVGSVVVV